MTQQHLADEVGVTRQTIVAIEKGKYAPSLDLAFRIALAFDVPLGSGLLSRRDHVLNPPVQSKGA